MKDTVEKPLTGAEKRTLVGENESRIVVIDIGKKQKKKAIRQLHQGRGKLLPKVQEAVKGVQQEMETTGAPPVVVVVVRKKKRRRWLW